MANLHFQLSLYNQIIKSTIEELRGTPSAKKGLSSLFDLRLNVSFGNYQIREFDWMKSIPVLTAFRALSIQQNSPVQIFGIFAGRIERVRPLPRMRGHVLCNTRHAG